MKGHGVSASRARQRYKPVTSTAGSGGAGEALPGSGSPYSDPEQPHPPLCRLLAPDDTGAGRHPRRVGSGCRLSLPPSPPLLPGVNQPEGTEPLLPLQAGAFLPAAAQTAHLAPGPAGMEERGAGGSQGGLGSSPRQRSDRGTPAGPPAPPPSPARRRPAAAPRPAPGAPVTPSPAPSSRAPRHAPAALRQAQPKSGTRHPGNPSSRRDQARPRNSSSSRAVSGAGRDARAFPAGPRAAGPALPGVQPACPNAAVEKKRGRGRAPAAASCLRPPVPRTGRLPLSLPPFSPAPPSAPRARGGHLPAVVAQSGALGPLAAGGGSGLRPAAAVPE
ncbi:basic proline-rich protein-like [Ammospiza nelsoni]|uniref:basic proline-rich protein-like n=1 Tax=Ammospiza nelsoni TaxID=2857394 RepID=UPI00286C74CE|nr:basic proline-rich protein-like [Ammospiza nelsoni]